MKFGISLENKCCLVTEGARDLGRQICIDLAKSGAKIAFTYSGDNFDAEETRAAMVRENKNAEILMINGSMRDKDHAGQVTRSVIERWGKIDALVNNAELGQIYPLALIEEENWDEIIDANLKTAFLFSRACLRYMIRAKKGSIVSLGSFASGRIIESPVHFASAKAGLQGFTESLAFEVGRYGILVNLVCPGLLDIGLSASLPQHRIKEYLAQSALGRVAKAEEISQWILFLISDSNSFITGAKIMLDGGL